MRLSSLFSKFFKKILRLNMGIFIRFSFWKRIFLGTVRSVSAERDVQTKVVMHQHRLPDAKESLRSDRSDSSLYAIYAKLTQMSFSSAVTLMLLRILPSSIIACAMASSTFSRMIRRRSRAPQCLPNASAAIRSRAA